MIDELEYKYHNDAATGKRLRNRLYAVRDYQSDNNAFQDDIDDMSFDGTPSTINDINNYRYDEEGRLIYDDQEDLSITWRVDGKVKKITRTDDAKQNIRFDYDAMGHRIAKHVSSLTNVLEKSVYYILDAQGNVMSVYERVVDASQQNVSYIQTDRYVYGSNRLGSNTRQVAMLGSQNSTYSMNSVRHQVGLRMYELTNHLGSVLSVISNKPIPHQNGTSVDYWLADIRQSTDYSPFGVSLSARNIAKFKPGTSFPIDNADGRYGYQGSEEYDEIKGEGNSYTTEMVTRTEVLSPMGSAVSRSYAGAGVDITWGGGVNAQVPGGNYSVIVMNSSAPINDYIDASGTSVSGRNSSPQELLAHELLGHGLGGVLHSPTASFEDAIQLTNLYNGHKEKLFPVMVVSMEINMGTLLY